MKIRIANLLIDPLVKVFQDLHDYRRSDNYNYKFSVQMVNQIANEIGFSSLVNRGGIAPFSHSDVSVNPILIAIRQQL